METNFNDIILVNKFYIATKSYRILLNLNKLIWEREDKQNCKTEVSVNDIIAVNVLHKCSATCDSNIRCLLVNKQNNSEIGEFYNSAFDENEFVYETNSNLEINKNDNQNLKYNNQNDVKNNRENFFIPNSSGSCYESQSNNTNSFNLESNSNGGESSSNSKQNIQINNRNSLNINNSNIPQYLEIIYAAKKISKSKQNFWRHKKIEFYSSNPIIIKLWVDSLRKILKTQNRPRRILLFVNPFGGEKRGLKLYETICKPLFQKANLDVECILTQRKNQIFDTLLRRKLTNFDGICCLGGDGTFAECFNGILFRTLKDFGLNPKNPDFLVKPKIPIGIIPGGSTDTIAFCCHGTSDVETACLHIILGQKRGLDLASIWNRDGLMRFYCSVMSYGFLGDVAKESEELRWMGPKRYGYSGFKKFLSNRSYYGEVLLSLETTSNIDSNKLIETTSNIHSNKTTTSVNITKNNLNNFNSVEEINENCNSDDDNLNELKSNDNIKKINQNINSESNDINDLKINLNNSNSIEFLETNLHNTAIDDNKMEKCFVNCIRCTNSASSLTNLNLQQKFELNRNILKSISMENVIDSDINEKHNFYPLNGISDIELLNLSNNNDDKNLKKINDNQEKNSVEMDNENLNKNKINYENINQIEYDNYAGNSSENNIIPEIQSKENYWKLIKGNFLFISVPNISCACNRSPQGLSQFSHLGDGCVDVILVRHTNFYNNLKLLIEISSPNGNINNLPFVESYRTRKFLFRGTKSNFGNLNQENYEISKLNKNINSTEEELDVQQNNDKSQWNCDGEIIFDSDVVINSHCQLIDVFMRGPYPIDDETLKTKCCC